MTFIRFMKDKARDIIFDKDPGFRVVAYDYIEYKNGVYKYRTIIQELRSGKFFKSDYSANALRTGKNSLKPFDKDEPVFQEVVLNRDKSRAPVWRDI